MQKYAKKMIATICLFLASTLWYQSHNAVVPSDSIDDQKLLDDNDAPDQANKAPWFNIACVPSHMARHGLDSDLRKKGLSQFTKNIETYRQTHRPGAYRCYFRVNPEHIACFNPRLITKEYLDENGYDTTMAFPGGSPGQICYFKKEFASNYTTLITILKRNNSVHDLQKHIVPSAHAAAEKLSGTKELP